MPRELTVKVFNNDLDKAIRILKKKMQSSQVFKLAKLKESYEKPSEKRKRKQRESEVRRKKVLLKYGKNIHYE